MLGWKSTKKERSSMTNTSRDPLNLTERQPQETISLINRYQIVAKLGAMKTEIEATMRLLNNPESQITYAELEEMQFKYGDVLDTVLNPR